MNFFQKNKEYADNFNRYFNVIKNICLIISTIVGIISKIIDISFVKSFLTSFFNIPDSILKIIIDKGNIAFVVVALLLLWSLCVFIRTAFVARIKNEKRCSDLVKMIHENFIHSIRSHIVELDVLQDKIGNCNSDNKLFEEELDRLKRNIQPYVDTLESYLSNYRNQKISVCVKTFLDRSQNKNDYLNEELITIARSKSTKKSRTFNNRSVVGKNSDFIDLCCGKSTFYGKSGLKELYDSGLYQNDSPNWWKNYNSTLVAPIRYYGKDGVIGKMNINFDIIGFLCIDCKEDIKEWESINSFELQLLAVLADSLYVYIKKFNSCFIQADISHSERS